MNSSESLTLSIFLKYIFLIIFISVSVLFTADKSIFNIGEAGALNINIQGTTAWEMISIFKTIDGIQTSIGNITESLTSPQFFSNHVSLSADSVSDENGANIIIDFEPVECDDDGIYTVEVRMNEVQYVKVDNEITVECKIDVLHFFAPTSTDRSHLVFALSVWLSVCVFSCLFICLFVRKYTVKWS